MIKGKISSRLPADDYSSAALTFIKYILGVHTLLYDSHQRVWSEALLKVMARLIFTLFSLKKKMK